MHATHAGADWMDWMGGPEKFHRRMRRHFEKHGRPGFWRDFMGEPGQRAERGVVRTLVLDAVSKQPRHGYEIMQAITERSGGTYKPSPGVIYPTLQMLEELRLVRGTEADGRKVYEITDEGKRELAEHQYDVDDFYERSAPSDAEEHADAFADLASDVGRLYRLYKRAARRGHLTGAVKKAVRAEFDRALDRIEEILGGE